MNKIMQNKSLITFFFSISLLLMNSCSSGIGKTPPGENQPVVPLRAWQLHELNDLEDMDYIRRVMEKAPEYDINTLVFSHGMIGAIHDLYEGGDEGVSPFEGMEHGRKLNELAREAESKGLKTWIWIHELEDVPERFVKNGVVQLDDPGIYEFLKERYRKAFEDFPAFDGVMLTFHETRYKLFDDTEAVSEMSPPERFAKLTNTIHEVCKEYNKDLVVRTFVYTMEELEWAREGFSQTDPEVMIQSKTVPQDWEAFFPHNPVIGSFPDRRHIIEFDCSNEYTGKNFIPYTSPEYFAFRWLYDIRQPGVAGFNLRLDHKGYDALFTPNSINIYSIYRLTNDTTLTTDQIWKEWTTEQYGMEAAPHIEAALKPSFEIVNKAFFPLGFWFSKHSGLPEYNYAGGHITGHTSVTDWWPEEEPDYKKAPWWPEDVSKAAWAERENLLMKPTPADMERLIAEKDTALILAGESLFHLQKAQPYITRVQYDELYEMLARLQLVSTIRRMHAEAYFGLRTLEAGHEVPGLKERISRSVKGLYMLAELTRFNTPWVVDTTAYHQPPAVPWKTREVAWELENRLEELK
jgi:hypothetical protein